MSNFYVSFLLSKLHGSVNHNSMIHAKSSKEQAASPYVHMRVKEKALPSERNIDLHITLDGVNAVIY